MLFKYVVNSLFLLCGNLLNVEYVPHRIQGSTSFKFLKESLSLYTRSFSCYVLFYAKQSYCWLHSNDLNLSLLVYQNCYNFYMSIHNLFSECTTFQTFQKSIMILQFFLHVLGVPIMFEHKKVTEVLGNKIVDTI